MKKSALSGKTLWIALGLVVLAAAVYGYQRQTQTMTQAEEKTAVALDAELLKVRPSDIINGDHNALATMVEYSSLTCPHCAHFHKDILPKLEKNLVQSGKLKLIVRHFPLNEPALRAAQLVECVGRQGGDRFHFLQALFDTQEQWAFKESYLADLKRIVALGGVDSAAADSCIADKDLETRILNTRRDAAEKLGVNSTPSFFINGQKYSGEYSVDAMQAAIAKATNP